MSIMLSEDILYHMAALAIVIMLYIISLVLIYLNWKFAALDNLPPILNHPHRLPLMTTSMIFFL